MATPRDLHVLAVHGNGGGAGRFAAMGPHLPQGVVLVAEDLPGFGDAAAAGPLASLEAYGDHLVQRVTELPRPRVVLGHGIGGSLALQMLQRADGVIDGLILHAPVGANLDTRRLPWVMRRSWVRAAARRALALPLLRPFWRRRLFAGPVPRDVERRFFDGYRHCPGFGPMFEWITAEWFAALEPIDVRTILLWGQEETVLDAGQAQAFASVVPNARVELVSGWGHFPMLEQPGDYARRIARLARELLAPAARQPLVEAPHE